MLRTKIVLRPISKIAGDVGVLRRLCNFGDSLRYDVVMGDRRKRHRSQTFREPRVTAQAVPIRCDRQVDECWVAVRDGLIKAVERFIEPACCPIQNGAKECHLQQDVEVQLGFCSGARGMDKV